MAQLIDGSEISGMILDQDKEYYNLLSIHVRSGSLKDFPLDIPFSEELNSFLNSGVLKTIDQQQVRGKFERIMSEKRVCTILRYCFWYVMYRRFPETVDVSSQANVISEMRGKLSRKYMKLFQALPQPKDELVSLLIFSVAYVVHFCFYKYFSPQREYFDSKFVIGCYQILLHEFNGIEVSEIYVRMMVEKIFTNKFLDYETTNIKDIIQQQIERKKLANRAFLGFQLKFPDIASNSKEGSSFKDNILIYLKKDKKSLHEKQQRFQGSQSSKTLESIDRISHLEGEKHHNVGMSNNNNNNNNSPGNSRMMNGGSQDFFRSRDNLNPNKKLRMNCNQVSPTMAKLLNYTDNNLPYTKKMIIKHVPEVTSQPILRSRVQLISESPNFGEKGAQGGDSLTSNKYHSTTGLQLQTSMLQPSHVSQSSSFVGIGAQTIMGSNSNQKQSFVDMYAMRAPSKEYYEQQEKYKNKVKLYKDMMDMNYVLSSTDGSAGQLPSSLETMQLYNNKLASRTAAQAYANQLKEKLEDAKRATQEIERYKVESGNQEIFDMPFTGTRSETRKMLAKVKEQCRKNLESKSLALNSISTSPIKKNRIADIAASTVTAASTAAAAAATAIPLQMMADAAMSRKSKLDFSASIMKGISNNTRVTIDGNAVPSADTTKKASDVEDVKPTFNQLDPTKNQRKIEVHIRERAQKQEEEEDQAVQPTLPEYILHRSADQHLVYKDSRAEYRSKYNAIFDRMSVDDNINHIQHNLQQRFNLTSPNLPQL